MNNYYPHEVVGRGSETQRHVGSNLKASISRFNSLSPHDALKHHFTSLKTDLIFLQLMVSE